MCIRDRRRVHGACLLIISLLSLQIKCYQTPRGVQFLRAILDMVKLPNTNIGQTTLTDPNGKLTRTGGCFQGHCWVICDDNGAQCNTYAYGHNTHPAKCQKAEDCHDQYAFYCFSQCKNNIKPENFLN
eukprot:TRINITY_DN6068_c0_g1_i1.p2 TRINITY_DN6068_c0_g1~~TRINITY_DN6068_c0_g1_i1.p2  ORF type:complete len:128 (-),score=1.94 TRINITY_DN6068_c0_g1_i1:65-448(-)